MTAPLSPTSPISAFRLKWCGACQTNAHYHDDCREERALNGMSLPVSEASRKPTLFELASDGLAVYPLWKGTVPAALLAFDELRASLDPPVGVVAVLPYQRLDPAEMDAMEDAGLLVVEVPHSLRRHSENEVADFVARCVAGAPEPAATSAVLVNAIANCRMFASRHRKEAWAQAILRFCAEDGRSVSSALRESGGSAS